MAGISIQHEGIARKASGAKAFSLLWILTYGLKPVPSISPKWSEFANEQFAFIDHLGRQMIVEFDEEFFVSNNFFSPGCAIDGH
jgi:hypothetical protein